MKLRWVAFWSVVGVGLAMLVTSVLNELDRQKRMTELMREMIIRAEKVESTHIETFNTDHPTESWK